MPECQTLHRLCGVVAISRAGQSSRLCDMHADEHENIAALLPPHTCTGKPSAVRIGRQSIRLGRLLSASASDPLNLAALLPEASHVDSEAHEAGDVNDRSSIALLCICFASFTTTDSIAPLETSYRCRATVTRGTQLSAQYVCIDGEEARG